MGSGGPGPDPGVQADGEDVDQDLPVAGLLRNLELLVVRWLAPTMGSCVSTVSTIWC